MKLRLIPFVAMLLVAACGSEASPPPGSSSSSTTSSPTTTPIPTTATTVPATTSGPSSTTGAPTTTSSSTSTSTTSTSAPATTAAPGAENADLPVTALAWGLFCRDLEPRGYGYAEAASYWILEGRPARMDADRNGIPCETVYPASEVEAYWGSPLPTSSPGPGPGWSASTYEPAASPGCCDANPSAPPSPPLPPETGPFPDDGVYHVQIHRVKGEHAELLVTIRRWVPCSQLPEECYSYSDTEGDATVDRSSSVVRSIPLNEDLAVVINGIPVHGPGTWEVRRIAGDGVALSRLLERLDAAYDHVVRPRYDPETPLWDVESRLASWGDRDPTLPFGAELWDESGGFFHYRGPAETPLTCSFYSVWPGSEAERVDWMYGWWPSLEIVDGSPILYLEAGQIAG